MKNIESSKLNGIIAKDYDALREIVGEYGDESMYDEDVEMVMEKHSLTAKEAVALLDTFAFAMQYINLITVKGADKAAAEVLGRFDFDDSYMGAMYTRVWHGASEGIRESLVKCFRIDAAAFMAGIKKKA